MRFCAFGGKIRFWRENEIFGFGRITRFFGFDGKKKAFLWFWHENTFLRFWHKTRFCGFGIKHVFAVKTRFFGVRGKCVLARKYVLAVFTEKYVLAENTFLRFSRKMHFDEETHFSVLTRKHILWFWRENVFCVLAGNMLCVLAEKYVFGVLV